MPHGGRPPIVAMRAPPTHWFHPYQLLSHLWRVFSLFFSWESLYLFVSYIYFLTLNRCYFFFSTLISYWTLYKFSFQNDERNIICTITPKMNFLFRPFFAIYLYIFKNWSMTFISATLLLSHFTTTSLAI